MEVFTPWIVDPLNSNCSCKALDPEQGFYPGGEKVMH